MLTRVGAAAGSLTPAQAITIGLIWRFAKRLAWRRGRGTYDSWQDEDPWSRTAAPSQLPQVYRAPQGRTSSRTKTEKLRWSEIDSLGQA